jgi:hypothetical protein
MTVRYGKIEDNLIALKETGLDHDTDLMCEGFDVLWTIDEKKLEHVVNMLIEAGSMGVGWWRINQIRLFYDITDEELMKMASVMNIAVKKVKIATTGESYFILRTNVRNEKGFTTGIESKSNDILLGIVQLLVRSGYTFLPRNSST